MSAAALPAAASPASSSSASPSEDEKVTRIMPAIEMKTVASLMRVSGSLRMRREKRSVQIPAAGRDGAGGAPASERRRWCDRRTGGGGDDHGLGDGGEVEREEVRVVEREVRRREHHRRAQQLRGLVDQAELRLRVGVHAGVREEVAVAGAALAARAAAAS